MNPRFDLFQKQNDRLIQWIGTTESVEDLEKLIRTNSTIAPQDNYVVFRSACGATEALTMLPSEKEKELRITVLKCERT